MTVVQEVVKLVPQEHVRQRAVEHAPVHQILEETVEGGEVGPTRNACNGSDEHIVDVHRVPQVDVLEALQSHRAVSHELQGKFFEVESDKRRVFD